MCSNLKDMARRGAALLVRCATPLSDKLSILTDELCSYLKVQTVSKQQMLGNAVFVNDLLMSRLLYGQLKAVSLSLIADAERGDTAQSLRSQPGAVLETSSKLMKATFFCFVFNR